MIYITIAGLALLATGLILRFIYSKPKEALDLRTRADGSALPAPTPLNKKWIHGSTDSKSNTDPAIEVFRFDQSSYILRQNKCLDYEAPFMYLLFGKNKVLLLDTGATKDTETFPLFKTVESLIAKSTGNEKRELFVIHSHHHTDHYAGDSQFTGKANVTLVQPTGAAMREFFTFEHWPNGEAHFDLGDRELTIIPTPGHQEDSISLYDSRTRWLLTGDTLYPGYVHVKNWDEYTESIARLDEFAKSHEVTAVLGAHIEMSTTPGEIYPIGTTYQPDEAPLPLPSNKIAELHTALEQLKAPAEIRFDEMIIGPMGFVQKTISNVVRFFILIKEKRASMS